MDQKKTGCFLKQLRNEKGLTQEQLANEFGVAQRTVSRWETGSNMPDISMLVEIAEFYEVDIREIIDGERKSENMNDEVKETILAVADYADKQKKQAVLRAIIMFALEMLCCGFTIASIILIESSDVKISLWFAAIPLAMTIAYSVLLVINAKSYIRKVQKERQLSVSRCFAMPTLTSLCLFVAAAFAVCIFARMRLPVCKHPTSSI